MRVVVDQLHLGALTPQVLEMSSTVRGSVRGGDSGEILRRVQVRAAKSMLAGTLQEVWAALHAAHGGRVVVHLAAPDLADTRRSPDVPEMLQWRASHRTVFQRHLLQQRTALSRHYSLESSHT